MRNILFIAPDFYPNNTGFAHAVTNLVDAILEFGSTEYKIWVFTTRELGNSKEKTDVNVIRYKSNIPNNRITYKYVQYLKAKYIQKIVENNNIDIIFFETNTFPYLQNYLLKKYKEKIVVRIHSTADTEVPVFLEPTNYFSKLCRNKVFEFMNGVSNIVSTSNYYLNFVRRYFLDGNVYKMWNGKNYGLIYNTVGGDKHNSYINRNTFMTMGKMSYNGVTQKGMEDLINAVFIMKKRGKLPQDFILYIIGDGDYVGKINKLISLYLLDNYVKIIKKLDHDEVFELMAKCKAIILLSRYEGQSMFITEALANGKPIIISDNNGMQDMIINDYNGKIVQTGNPEEAAKVLSDFINLNDEVIEKYGNNSLALYRSQYSTKAIFNQFNDLINRIML